MSSNVEAAKNLQLSLFDRIRFFFFFFFFCILECFTICIIGKIGNPRENSNGTVQLA